MEERAAFTFSGRIRSLRPAVSGIGIVFRSQENAWVHSCASLGVVITGLSFRLSPGEWTLLITAMALVWIAEALNTAFEFLCDVVSPDFHPLVKKAKDVAAGAVLISAVAALAIGALVFVPCLIRRFGE